MNKDKHVCRFVLNKRAAKRGEWYERVLISIDRMKDNAQIKGGDLECFSGSGRKSWPMLENVRLRFFVDKEIR